LTIFSMPSTSTQRTVLLINPNTSVATTRTMQRLARLSLPPGFALESATVAHGASIITSDAELASAIEQVVAIGRARTSDVAAIVIAAFGDPGVAALRAEVAVPVIGIGEAAMRLAAEGGRRFGIATITQALKASIGSAVAQHGLAQYFTGCQVPPTEPARLAADPARLDAYLEAAVSACIADGAEAVVIGGGPLAESAARIAGRFDVPVISPIDAAMRAVAWHTPTQTRG
jgi:allantoin racemase